MSNNKTLKQPHAFFRIPMGQELRDRLHEVLRARGLKIGWFVCEAIKEKLDREEQAK